jgi:hypothetical protein
MMNVNEIDHTFLYVMDKKILLIDQNIADLVHAKEVFKRVLLPQD